MNPPARRFFWVNNPLPWQANSGRLQGSCLWTASAPNQRSHSSSRALAFEHLLACAVFVLVWLLLFRDCLIVCLCCVFVSLFVTLSLCLSLALCIGLSAKEAQLPEFTGLRIPRPPGMRPSNLSTSHENDQY